MAGRTADVRTMVIGLDSACLTVLDRLEEGTIPTLRSLLARGASGPLRSQIPPWTPSAWPSLYTGMNPGKHGVFDFLAFEGYDWSVVNASHVRERPFWELLSRAGYESVVVNAPVTHPPRAFEGALVPGYMAPEGPTCHPEGLLSDIEAAVGPYRVYPEDTDDERGYTEVVRSRGETFRYLADRFDPDAGFLQFQVTDTVFHDRPEDWPTIEAVYAAVDTEIERTLSACDPETVFVVSDHGMGPLSGVGVNVNDYLAGAGFVETVNGGAGMPTWSTVRDGQLKDGTDADTDDTSAWGRLAAAGARLGLTSQRVGGALERVGLAETVAGLLPSAVINAGTEQVSFPDSRAYMRSRTECGVRLNVAGREPDGVVDPEAYEHVRATLVEHFRSLRTPDGDPVFESVLPREAVFEGPAAEQAVDILTVPAGFEHFLSSTIGGSVFGTPAEPWNHKLEGLVVASGAGIDTSETLEGATIFDIAPTVLATLSVPADDRMDGRCLPVVEAAGRREYPRPQRADPTATDDDAVAQRLSDLGYLE